MNEKIKLKIVGFYQPVPSDKSCFIILQEMDGNRKIAVQIGVYESDAIIFMLENIKTSKPFIHDLFFNLAKVSNVQVTEVLINRYEKGRFDSNLTFEYGAHNLIIPIRPCDAIALAIRFEVPVLIYEEVLESAAIQIKETTDLKNLSKIKEASPPQELIKLKYDELKQLLKSALDSENYELAGKIRDELLKRNLPGAKN
jgi:bifunctional DNase/RNase